MLTALSVRLPERQTGIRGAAQRLRRDKIQIEVKKARGVTLKHITYISFSGQVRLDKTDKIIGSQRSRLLCSDKLIFPHHSGYKRFSSAAFSPSQRWTRSTVLVTSASWSGWKTWQILSALIPLRCKVSKSMFRYHET